MPTVFITGASRGIGRAAALLFAGQGYLTAVNYNRTEAEALSLIDKIRSFGGDVYKRQPMYSLRNLGRRLYSICSSSIVMEEVISLSSI